VLKSQHGKGGRKPLEWRLKQEVDQKEGQLNQGSFGRTNSEDLSHSRCGRGVAMSDRRCEAVHHAHFKRSSGLILNSD